jgi:hypothetical protein
MPSILMHLGEKEVRWGGLVNRFRGPLPLLYVILSSSLISYVTPACCECIL